MKMKNLRKMVSVVLSVIISCMCLVSHVSAANEVGKANTAISMNTNYDINPQATSRTFGVTRIYAVPAVYDANVDDITEVYTDYMSYTQYVSGGTDILNLYISFNSQSKYYEYNCNAWVIQLDYSYDPNVSRIELVVDGKYIYSKSNDSQHYMAFYFIGELSGSERIPYNLIATYKDGGTLWAGGHVGLAQIA